MKGVIKNQLIYNVLNFEMFNTLKLNYTKNQGVMSGSVPTKPSSVKAFGVTSVNLLTKASLKGCAIFK